MPDTNNAVQHRIPADGADPLSLGGVNDANLLELGKRAGLRVVLRDDHLLLSGDLKDVERAVPVAQHMVQMARNGVPFGTDDVARYLDASVSESGVRRMADLIDFDAGHIIEGASTIEETGEALLDHVIEVASGRVTPAAVRLAQDDFTPWKRGVSL